MFPAKNNIMKKQQYLLHIILITFLFISCNNGEENSENSTDLIKNLELQLEALGNNTEMSKEGQIVFELAQSLSDIDTLDINKYKWNNEFVTYLKGQKKITEWRPHVYHEMSNSELMKEHTKRFNKLWSRNISKVNKLGLDYRELEFVSETKTNGGENSLPGLSIITVEFKYGPKHFNLKGYFVNDNKTLFEIGEINALSESTLFYDDDVHIDQYWSKEPTQQKLILNHKSNETLIEFSNRCKRTILLKLINSSYFITEKVEGQRWGEEKYGDKNTLQFTMRVPDHSIIGTFEGESIFTLNVFNDKGKCIYLNSSILDWALSTDRTVPLKLRCEFEDMKTENINLNDQITIILKVDGKEIFNKKDKFKEFLYASGLHWKFHGVYGNPPSDRDYYFDELSSRRELYHFKLNYK